MKVQLERELRLKLIVSLRNIARSLRVHHWGVVTQLPEGGNKTETRRGPTEREKANRIQVLENTVKSLQSLIEDWKEKYKTLYEELGTTKCRLDEVTSENESLKIQLEKQSYLIGEGVPEREIELPHKQATSSHLTYLIENMKPMKAVPLKKRRTEAELDTAYHQSPEKLVHPQHTNNRLPDFSAHNPSSTASSSGSTNSPFPLPPVPLLPQCQAHFQV